MDADFGHLLHRAPRRVEHPGSAGEAAEAILRAAPAGFAARGRGHSVRGRAQAPGGTVAATDGPARVGEDLAHAFDVIRVPATPGPELAARSVTATRSSDRVGPGSSRSGTRRGCRSGHGDDPDHAPPGDALRI